uniref:Uncharacterized protein n=1 Tax=Arundo donax TaxID=35708 RepID=A0A0A8ZRE4_ARUDO
MPIDTICQYPACIISHLPDIRKGK